MNLKINKNKISPMMQQYFEIKSEYSDCMLFFRMGDFYELFFDDAIRAASILNITLTKRGTYQNEDIPMCGVPVSAGDSYLSKLIDKNIKVAVCEQIETPEESKKRGYKAIIKRKVTRIATPGTLTGEFELTASNNNYILTLYMKDKNVGACWIDISTGEIKTKLLRKKEEILFLVSRIQPAEILFNSKIENFLKSNFIEKESFLSLIQNENFFFDRCLKKSKDVLKVSNLKVYGDFAEEEVSALGTSLDYILFTQSGKIPVFSSPIREVSNSIMIIDSASKKNLEISETLSKEKEGSLFYSVNYTKSSAGARKLLNDLMSPLNNLKKINERLNIIEFFYNDNIENIKIQKVIAQLPDISRSITRLGIGRGGPRDLVAIMSGIKKGYIARDIILSSSFKGESFNLVLKLLNGLENMKEMVLSISNSIVETPPLSVNEGGFVRKGFNKKLDEIKELRENIKNKIVEMEKFERERTGIKSLKIKYNNFIGYYIDVTASNKSFIIEDYEYIHRQTLKNSIRFTTRDLVSLAEKILNSEAKYAHLELEIFNKIVELTLKNSESILLASTALAKVDVALSWSYYAKNHNAIKPKVFENNNFKIINGRHPSIEKIQEEDFISNSCELNYKDKNFLWLITGPNMAGKSTFLRQNALIAIMAQAGGYVPASSANIGLFDRIFCRVGASDELAKGRSTFMVEMQETATILNQASSKSLVILDEIGRGTSTFDGMSIAWSTIEYLLEKIKCRTLFATHYHEITELSNKYEAIKLYTLKVNEYDSKLIFLHDVVKGISKGSYGINVANMAGFPKSVTNRAENILKYLESKKLSIKKTEVNKLEELDSYNSFQTQKNQGYNKVDIEIIDKIKNFNLDDISPKEALDILYNLSKIVKTKKTNE